MRRTALMSAEALASAGATGASAAAEQAGTISSALGPSDGEQLVPRDADGTGQSTCSTKYAARTGTLAAAADRARAAVNAN